MAEQKIRIKKMGFTAVSNSVIRDETLSLKTLGLFVMMQSFPDDWEYSISGLAARARVGRNAIRECLNELEDTGYLVRKQNHTGGRFGNMVYTLQTEAPSLAEKPVEEKMLKRGFTAVSNSVIRDERLSLKTLGLFAMMRSFPEDWNYTVSGLTIKAREGRVAVRKCLSELEDAGYLVRKQSHTEDGQFGSMVYILQSEAPLAENGLAENGAAENGLAGNGTQDNKHLSKKTSKKNPHTPLGGEGLAAEKQTDHEIPTEDGTSRETKVATNVATEDEGLFEAFWSAYPKKKAKVTARKVWAKLKPDATLCAILLAALERQKQCESWQRDNGRYIPYPTTWLNQCRWEDEMDEPAEETAVPQTERRPRYVGTEIVDGEEVMIFE